MLIKMFLQLIVQSIFQDTVEAVFHVATWFTRHFLCSVNCLVSDLWPGVREFTLRTAAIKEH